MEGIRRVLGVHCMDCLRWRGLLIFRNISGMVSRKPLAVTLGLRISEWDQRDSVVGAAGIESALKRQTKDLTEHGWQIRALQVYGSQETDFRNHFLSEAEQLTLNPYGLDAPKCSEERRLPESTDCAQPKSTSAHEGARNSRTN